jgi:hypothetical protein
LATKADDKAAALERFIDSTLGKELTAMTCREFEHRWNELLDGCQGALAVSAEPEPTNSEQLLNAHAARCARCHDRAMKYQSLRNAIRAWDPPLPAPAGLADRVVAELRAPASPALWIRAIRWAAAASIAASVLAIVVIDRMVSRGRPNAQQPMQVEHGVRGPVDARSHSAPYRGLNTALADATAATLDLARAASEPAARVGRQLIDAAANRETSEPGTTSGAAPTAVTMVVSVPSLDLLAPDTAATAEMWQQVGNGLASGVRPLKSTAQHAFGFLLGPPPVKPELRNVPRAQKGA